MLYDTKWDKPVVVEERWRQLLLDAADAIKENGWCQGKWRDENGRVCALGAIDMASAQGEYSGRDIGAAIDQLQKFASAKGHDGIARWNDDFLIFGRSRVMRAMKNAAKGT